SPEAPNLLSSAEACIKGGTDGLSLINTIRGMSVNIETPRPQLDRVFGGLSGPAIRPIALRYVHEVRSRFDIPIIAMGGIANYRDALEFIITGANLVAV